MGKKVDFLVIFLLGVVFSATIADPVEDKQALLDFLKRAHHSHTLNWKNVTSVCRAWSGVTCNRDQSRVIALRLPGIGLSGPIPSNTLSRLSALQALSLRSNTISGSFPADFSELRNLTALYLQSNNFSGPLPDFSYWKELSVVNLAENGFNGSIPLSVNNLTHLTTLNLSNNSLSGDIPDINIPSLQQLNLANNNLTGRLPRSLQRFPSSAFLGNNLTSEDALPPALPYEPPSAQPSHKHRKISESALLGIVLGSCVLAFVVVALLMVICCSTSDSETGLWKKSQKKDVTKRKNVSETLEKGDKLIFFEGCNLAFDLEDLLRASAEVLGKGTFGVTYKAALEDATTVAVKRLKEVSAGKRDFEQQMELVGNIKHANVTALRAYFYSKDEKLTVCDYYDQGSVSSMIHGNRGEGRTSLDWETRLRIAIGAARGLAHIHTQYGGRLVHGNIKASNIFINTEGYGSVADTGLASVMNSLPSQVLRAAGYRAPEITDSRKATQASDVYSYGVMLLELLTGKSPAHATGTDQVVHLVRWVHSVVREEWTAEVFDVELLRYPNIEEEMVELLQLAMNCVTRMPEQRPEMADVVRMVEGIRRRVDVPNQLSSGSMAATLVTNPVILAADVASSSASSVQY